MERKNTMLLTVIAVATLLVAVVGATFAFFTASSTGTAVSNVTVTTETNSSTTASNSPASIYVTAAEMETTAQKVYSATGAVSTTTATSNTGDADGYVQLVLSNGSATNEYECTYDLVYNTTGDTYVGANDDITLILTPSVTTGSTTDAPDDVITQTLNGLANGTELASDQVITLAAGSASQANAATLKYLVQLTVENTEVDQTTNLSNKSITGSVSVENLVCITK